MLKKLLIFTRALTIALFHDMHQGSITLRVMGLVYTTLLALSFSVVPMRGQTLFSLSADCQKAEGTQVRIREYLMGY